MILLVKKEAHHLIDIFIIAIVILVLIYLSIKTSKKGKCARCHKHCAHCGIKTSFYEEYKKDQKEKNNKLKNEE